MLRTCVNTVEGATADHREKTSTSPPPSNSGDRNPLAKRAFDSEAKRSRGPTRA
jgi:hypothetical protein